jgi:hypothetical protein
MLLPRFTLRTLLAILTAVAVLSLLAGQALGGRAWALGVTVAVVSVPLALVVHAAFFSMAISFAGWLGAKEVVARTSRGGVERSLVAPSNESAAAPVADPAGTTP